ncbi:SGNH/GDSL hydrolase family protein [Streptomyces sp. 6N223]|uniref:SGNH/GDSL hydrolase family protein n=1 Tax=Streptomyces sp. 6N223 TaxID=3457412 RepID=UPI003FD14D21
MGEAGEAGGAGIRRHGDRLGVRLLSGSAAIVLGLVLALVAGAPTTPVLHASDDGWVATWAAAPTGAEPGTEEGMAGRSVRNVVRASVGGSGARVELSNVYGTLPVTFTSVTLALALPGGGPGLREGTVRVLTFTGREAVTVPAGEAALSDPVRLDVPAAAALAVTAYAPQPSGPVTYHHVAQQGSYVADGDLAAAVSGAAYAEASARWRYLTAVHVRGPAPGPGGAVAGGAVVVLGDSLTDALPAEAGTSRRWTDRLAARLRQERPGRPLAVLNLGISGNRLLRDASPERAFNGPAGLARLEPDVFAQAGARTVVLQLGINDILKRPHETDAEELVDGMRELADRSRAAGLRVVGCTISPFLGRAGVKGDVAELDATRREANELIRAGGVFDAVIDIDAALRDPARPDRLLAAYDSGDALHPNEAGQRAMADAVDLSAL